MGVKKGEGSPSQVESPLLRQNMFNRTSDQRSEESSHSRESQRYPSKQDEVDR